MHKNWTLQIENESSPSNNFTMSSSPIFLVDALTETLDVATGAVARSLRWLIKSGKCIGSVDFEKKFRTPPGGRGLSFTFYYSESVIIAYSLLGSWGPCN